MKELIFALIVLCSASVQAQCPGGNCSIRGSRVQRNHTVVRQHYARPITKAVVRSRSFGGRQLRGGCARCR